MVKSPSSAASTSSTTQYARGNAAALRLRGARRRPAAGADSAGAAPAVGTRVVGKAQSPLPPDQDPADRSESTWRADGRLSGARQYPPPPRHRGGVSEAIAAARRRSFLANAYFLPGRRFRRALHDAAGAACGWSSCCRGGSNTASCTTPRRRFMASCWAPASASSSIGAASCMPRWRSSTGHWATVGSSNIDPFSLLLAREANVVVRDDALPGNCGRVSAGDAQGARELPVDSWKRLPWHSRLLHLGQLQPGADSRRHCRLRRQALDPGKTPRCAGTRADRPGGNRPAPEIAQRSARISGGTGVAKKVQRRRQHRAATRRSTAARASVWRVSRRRHWSPPAGVRKSASAAPGVAAARSGVASSRAGRRRGRLR
jgi:hypothetical protein